MSSACINFLVIFVVANISFAYPEDLLNASVHRLSAESCKSCHKKQYREWNQSKHKMSYTNSLFQKNYAHEKHSRCLSCHLPLEVQRKSIGSLQENLLEEGVTCSSCHDSNSNQKSKLSESKMCSKCHQFDFLKTETAAQNTYVEWQTYKNNGGTKSCQNCHMKNGSHDFRFQEPETPYSKALKISTSFRNGVYKLKLKNVDAGHNIPTGDIFRHIQLQVWNGEKFDSFYSIGRNPYFLPKENKLIWKNKNSIAPNQEVEVLVPTKKSTIVRVVYFKEARWAGKPYFFSELAQVVLYEKML